MALYPGFPDVRYMTLGPSDPVPSKLLNLLQDGVIGAKHASHRWSFPPFSRTANDFSMTFTNGMYFAAANNAAINYTPVPVWEGDRVTSLHANVVGTGGAGNVVVRLSRWKDGVQTIVGTLTIIDPPNAWANYDAAIDPFVIQAGESYWLNCSFALANQGVSAFGINTDRL